MNKLLFNRFLFKLLIRDAIGSKLFYKIIIITILEIILLKVL